MAVIDSRDEGSLDLGKGESHHDLVKAAGNWLRNTRRCRFVSCEHTTILPETPDAIGWAADGSILVECKTSSADFARDGEKQHRRFDGVGEERWFLCPRNVINPDKLPEGWGLLERVRCSSGCFMIRRVVSPALRPATVEMLLNERKMLVSAAWRCAEAASMVKPFSITESPELLGDQTAGKEK